MDAPQRGQVSCSPSTDVAHQGQIICGPVRWIGVGADGVGTWTEGEGAVGSGADVAGRLAWDPHEPQKFAVSEIFAPQFVQNIFDLLRVMMHVHRLDADPAGTGHAGEAHIGAAEKSRAQFLKFHLHRDR